MCSTSTWGAAALPSTISIRLSDDEREAFEARSAEMGTSLSGYLRLLARRDAGLDEQRDAEIAELRTRLERLEGMAGL
jgi:hypothetical protein